jgi:MFS family permease
VFALVEMSFGVGMIIGPTLGGALFQVPITKRKHLETLLQIGGFTLPFAVLGSILLLQALVSSWTLPVLTPELQPVHEESFGIIRCGMALTALYCTLHCTALQTIG